MLYFLEIVLERVYEIDYHGERPEGLGRTLDATATVWAGHAAHTTRHHPTLRSFPASPF